MSRPQMVTRSAAAGVAPTPRVIGAGTTAAMPFAAISGTRSPLNQSSGTYGWPLAAEYWWQSEAVDDFFTVAPLDYGGYGHAILVLKPCDISVFLDVETNLGSTTTIANNDLFRCWIDVSTDDTGYYDEDQWGAGYNDGPFGRRAFPLNSGWVGLSVQHTLHVSVPQVILSAGAQSRSTNASNWVDWKLTVALMESATLRGLP